VTLSLFGLAALEYARQGMAVFPLIPKSKKPLTSDGFHSATTDPEQITRWWTITPTANIGGVPASAGLVALDIDSPSCWSVAMSMGLLSEPTHRVTTGMSQPGAETAHLYFRHPAPPSDTKLGGVIVVRGARGYVVLPPSIHPVTGQAYTSDTSILDAVDLPDRAAIALMTSQAPAAASERASVALSAPVAQGGRHDAAVSVAGKLAGHGLLDDGWALFRGWNVTACTPPLDEDELRSVWEYAARREGAKRAERQAVHDTIDLSGLSDPTPPPTAPRRTILRVSELLQEPERIDFLVDDLLPRHGLGVLWAPSGAGKTFTTLDIALHVATGRPWQGRAVHAAHVLWVVGEGFPGMRARVAAWCTEHATDPLALEETFVIRRVGWDITDPAARREVLEELAALTVTPHLVVIDTLSSNGPGGFDESSTRDMKALMDAARVIRDGYGAMVLFTHHSGYDTTRMRGSSDQLGAVDVSLKLVPGKDGLVTLAVEKARDFARPEPVVLRLVPDHGAQVVRPAEAVDIGALLAATPHAHLTLLAALYEHGRPLRPKELETASGLGKYAYEVIRECVAQQYLLTHTIGAAVSYDLSEAGRRVVLANRPTPVTPLPTASVNPFQAGQSGQKLVR
jgi:hypothetical protein